MKKRDNKDWEKMDNFVQAFLHHPTYNKLTEDVLSSVPDAALEQAVIDNI